MKKFAQILLITAVMGGIVISCKTTFPTTQSMVKTVKTTASFERGKVLAASICAGCHYDHKVNKFIGTQVLDVPGIAGKVYSANLTQSKTHGVMAKYTDAEFKYLIKTGVARDGRYLSYMVRPNMAEKDLDALITYFRSDDATVRAADTTVGPTKLTFIGKAFMNLKAKPVPYQANVKVPSANDPKKLGYYLVDNLGCFHCHSKSLTNLSYLTPDQTKGYLAGGIKMKGENGTEVIASNITPDKNSGIGEYTKEQFYEALTTGKAPDRQLKIPMPKFDMLNRQEIDAIYEYLQTVPAKYHVVKKI